MFEVFPKPVLYLGTIFADGIKAILAGFNTRDLESGDCGIRWT